MSNDLLQAAWFERYRPQTLDQCILPDRFRTQFQAIIDDDELPNLLLASKSAGVGKTSIALILCEALGYDYIMINGSKDRNLDMLRDKIEGFASTNSFTNTRKCIIIDEADHLNPNSTQPALRGVIEEYASNCSFIFTCNQVNKLTVPIRSRFSYVDFDYNPEERKDMLVQAFNHFFAVLDKEGVEYNQKAVASLIKKNYPDFRKIFGILQLISKSGKIEDYSADSSGSVDKLVPILKSKDWAGTLEWCVDHPEVGIDFIIANLETNLAKIFKNKSQPIACIIMDDYQSKAAHVINQSINLKAMLSEMMMELEFS